MKIVTKCRHCGRGFSPSGRGRPQLYCRPSHRVRAREKRRELEHRVPGEKEFSLLRQRLESLRRCRVRWNRIPGIEEIRQFVGAPRGKAYQRAVERVREVLIRLAPEVVQDLGQPWLATLSAIEANGIIDRQEETAATEPLLHRKRGGLERRYRRDRRG
jgi:hypothetical protein